jgi:Family of unknown function (DUF6339)
MSVTKLQILGEDSFNTLHKEVVTSPLDLLKQSNEVKDFEDISPQFGLTLVESNYNFDDSMKLTLPRGKSWAENGDRKNCEIIFNALPDLTAIEATDERLWVTLCFNQFNDYANARWPIAIPEGPKSPEQVVSNSIREHRFASTARGRWRNNAVSRLWWMAHYAHSFEELDANVVLKILCLDSDLVGNLLGRPWTSNNRKVSIFLLKELQSRYLNIDAPPFNRTNFRNTLKELDLRAGKYVLAALDENQIEKLVHDIFKDHH